MAGMARLGSRIEVCSKRALKRCRHGMTADVMSGHKNVVRASRANEQGRKDVVRESRADEHGHNEQSRDQQGQNEWSAMTANLNERGGDESAWVDE